MPLPLDPDDARLFRMKMRASALERHARSRDPLTGKSTIAVAAGRQGGRATVDKHPSGSAWGLRLAMLRHHGIPLPKKEPASLVGDGLSSTTPPQAARRRSTKETRRDVTTTHST